jgi:prepilin-type N-terminal cleavage/methylation domain-containing protein
LLLAPRLGFTLVELLVVITIIGILVSLLVAAAMRAVVTARQAAIKTEVEMISGSIDKYKDKAGSYPPNAVIDDQVFTEARPEDENPATPIFEADVLRNMQRHFQQAHGRSKEPDTLLRKLVGDAGGLPGGMTAAEALVFWLSGFSADPLYPISGEGGPSYRIDNLGSTPPNQADPLESRKFLYPFDITRLGPRDGDGFFNGRFIVYNDPRDPSGSTVRRINFWTYNPGRSVEPALYFDVSRHPAAIRSSTGRIIGPFDPPASMNLHVHALKMRSQSATDPVPIQFANYGKFQVLHCGVDDAWGDEILERTSAHGVVEAAGGNAAAAADPNNYLLYPDGPFTGDAADTVVSFVTQARLEDAQPQ